MEQRLATQEGKKLYALRKQTVEPLFGIIKEAMGFRRFSLRGLAKVGLEWTLVTASTTSPTLSTRLRVAHSSTWWKLLSTSARFSNRNLQMLS